MIYQILTDVGLLVFLATALIAVFALRWAIKNWQTNPKTSEEHGYEISEKVKRYKEQVAVGENALVLALTRTNAGIDQFKAERNNLKRQLEIYSDDPRRANAIQLELDEFNISVTEQELRKGELDDALTAFRLQAMQRRSSIISADTIAAFMLALGKCRGLFSLELRNNFLQIGDSVISASHNTPKGMLAGDRSLEAAVHSLEKAVPQIEKAAK